MRCPVVCGCRCMVSGWFKMPSWRSWLARRCAHAPASHWLLPVQRLTRLWNCRAWRSSSQDLSSAWLKVAWNFTESLLLFSNSVGYVYVSVLFLGQSCQLHSSVSGYCKVNKVVIDLIHYLAYSQEPSPLCFLKLQKAHTQTIQYKGLSALFFQFGLINSACVVGKVTHRFFHR